MRKPIVLVIFIATSALLFGQDPDKALKYFENEQYELAAKEFQALLPKVKMYFGKNDTTVYSKFLIYTGVSYYKTEQYGKSEKHFLTAKQIYEKKKGTSHWGYVLTIQFLDVIYFETKQQAKSSRLNESVFKALEVNHPKDLSTQIKIISEIRDKSYINNIFYSAIIWTEKIIELIRRQEVIDYSLLVTELAKCANYYYSLNQNEKALNLLDESLQIAQDRLEKEAPGYLNVIEELGFYCEEMGDSKLALQFLLEAKAIAEKTPMETSGDNIRLTYKINKIYRKQGNYLKVIEYYRERLKTLEIIGTDHFFYIQELFALCDLLEKLGYYEEELIYYRKFEEKLADNDSLRNKYNVELFVNMAGLYSEIGKYLEAQRMFNQVLLFMEQNNEEETHNYATILNNYALMLSWIGLYEDAEYLYLKALEISKKVDGEESPSYGIIRYNYGLLLHHTGKYEEALLLYNVSIDEAKLHYGTQHPEYAKRLNSLANLYMQMKQFDASYNTFIEAYEISKNALGEEHSLSEEILRGISTLLVSTDKNQEASVAIRQAFDIMLLNLKIKFALLSEKEKYLALLRVYPVYDWNLSFYIKNIQEIPDLHVDAYKMELAVKGMILKSGIQMRQAIMNSSDDEAIQKFNEWFVIRESLAKQYSLPLAQRSKDLKDLELNAEQLESELNRLSSTFKQAQSLGSIKWQDVQQQLGENDVAIEFSSFPYYNGKQWTDSVLYTANVLRPDDEHPHLVYLCEQRQLDSLLYQQGNTEPGFVACLYRGAEPIETSMPSNGRRLYELIWKPISHLLPEGGTVFFAPSGSLHQIAHAAIPVAENTLLSDKYKLVQMSTTASLLQDDDQNETLTGEIALFGGIEYNMDADELIALSGQHQDIVYLHTQRGISAGLERSTEAWSYLPGTLTEVESIGKLAVRQGVSLKSYTRKEALEERFKALSGNNSPAILHIATHAFFFPDPEKELKSENFMLMGEQQQVFRASDNPLNRAGLLFAGANHTWQGDTVPEGVDDGILTAWEATNLTLANTRLVTLSACETGLGELRGSEGVFGLQRAFKATGAGYLLMSLWKVPDTETAEFMAFFYARLFEGAAITDAFHATQQYMKTQYPTEPYKWAAFVLTR